MTSTFQQLIEPQQLWQQLSSSANEPLLNKPPLTEPLLIIDLCGDQQYLSGHIPGAVHVSPSELMDGQPPAAGRLPEKHCLDALFSRLGLSANTTVIVYDDEGGGWAGRMAWTLDVIGHRQWLYLNGGLRAWHDENLPLETTVNEAIAIEADVNINTKPLIEAEDIMADLSGQHKLVIWDARSRGEYEGSRVVAQRGGHIPGAIHCEWTSLMDNNRSLKIRTDAAQYLESLGLGADKTIATHCQSHHRSGFTYLVARLLGYSQIQAYHGSWSEWGNRPDTPVETL